jgi:hypothetical protein
MEDEVFKQVPLPDFYKSNTIQHSELFSDIQYQSVSQGETYGVVRIVTNPAEMNYSSRDIVVCDSLPLELSPLRGLVTQQIQTPLCHVALLCNHQQIPDIALKNAFEIFGPYSGQLVHLSVLSMSYEVTLADEKTEQEWNEQRLSRRRPPPVLRSDFTYSEVSRLSAIPDSHIDSIGAKARNVRLIGQSGHQAINTKLNDLSFAIPFSYFRDYVQLVAGDEYSEFQESARSDLCGVLYDKISQGRLGEWNHLQTAVMKKIDEWRNEIGFGSGSGSELSCDGVILRSSSNCEDIADCPSAGLYHSELVDGFEWPGLEKGIVRVWSSVFNAKSFNARRSLDIDEKYVGMCILVMPLIKNCVAANGVALTMNPIRPDLGGLFLNVQVGTTAVTDACGGSIPEQVLIYHDNLQAISLQYISPSSLLRVGEYLIDQDLGGKLDSIFSMLQSLIRGDDGAIDAEFFILKTGEIVVVQARPIQMSTCVHCP